MGVERGVMRSSCLRACSLYGLGVDAPILPCGTIAVIEVLLHREEPREVRASIMLRSLSIGCAERNEVRA